MTVTYERRSSAIFWLALVGFIFVLIVFILLIVWLAQLGFSTAEQGFGISCLVLSALAVILAAVGAYGSYHAYSRIGPFIVPAACALRPRR